MTRTLILAATLLAISPLIKAQPTGVRSAQKHPVEVFFLSGIEAFNAHDLDRFMAQFANDIEMYTPTGWL